MTFEHLLGVNIKKIKFFITLDATEPINYIMNNKFLTFSKPYLSFIDNGHFFRKPIYFLYSILGIINLIFPLFLIYMAIDDNVLKSSRPPMFFISFALFLLIIVFASWISFQLWWDRKSKIAYTSNDGDDFIATHIFSHLIQTIGEWLGTWVGIVGFGTGILSKIFFGEDGEINIYQYEFLGTGWLFVVLTPIYGFLIIVVTRFLAEQFRALASIANNTSEKQNKNNKPSF